MIMRIAVLLSLAASGAIGKVYDKSVPIGDVTVHYKLVLPGDYDEAKAYPAVLAFPPGPQTMDMVFTTVAQNWSGEAQKRGYIVIVPAAPGGQLFFEGGSRVFPAFIEQMLKDYRIKDGKFHIAGMSNGGLSAFHIAASYPRILSPIFLNRNWISRLSARRYAWAHRRARQDVHQHARGRAGWGMASGQREPGETISGEGL